MHHGQATQHMFYNDPSVLYFSIHRYDYGYFYPGLKDANYSFTGEGEGKGFNINVPWNKVHKHAVLGERGKVGEWREWGGKLVRQERKGCSGKRIVSLMTDVTAVCCCRSEWDGGWGLPGGVQPPSPPSGLRGESAMLGRSAR